MRRVAAAVPELVAGTVAIVIAALFVVEARTLPPPFFEPIGSAAVPRATALIVLTLAAAMIVQALLRRPADAPPETPSANLRLALAFSALTVLYAAGLGLTRIGYAPLTVVFLAVAIPLLGGFDRRTIGFALASGIVLGFGLQFLFTRILVTDLP
ncbi:MAG TPA: tripartite tricarboxylate transporter TctB family protein [Beijerinckiaceae bacterium]|nr:tripartite tricarboxylate transporter TctB family protein [Beijerinckiaceae bacterium]